MLISLYFSVRASRSLLETGIVLLCWTITPIVKKTVTFLFWLTYSLKAQPRRFHQIVLKRKVVHNICFTCVFMCSRSAIRYHHHTWTHNLSDIILLICFPSSHDTLLVYLLFIGPIGVFLSHGTQWNIRCGCSCRPSRGHSKNTYAFCEFVRREINKNVKKYALIIYKIH